MDISDILAIEKSYIVLFSQRALKSILSIFAFKASMYACLSTTVLKEPACGFIGWACRVEVYESSSEISSSKSLF